MSLNLAEDYVNSRGGHEIAPSGGVVNCSRGFNPLSPPSTRRLARTEENLTSSILEHGRPHIGANGVSWPPGKMDEKLKSEKTQKRAVFYVYVIFWGQSEQAGVENGQRRSEGSAEGAGRTRAALARGGKRAKIVLKNSRENSDCNYICVCVQ